MVRCRANRAAFNSSSMAPGRGLPPVRAVGRQRARTLLSDFAMSALFPSCSLAGAHQTCIRRTNQLPRERRSIHARLCLPPTGCRAARIKAKATRHSPSAKLKRSSFMFGCFDPSACPMRTPGVGPKRRKQQRERGNFFTDGDDPVCARSPPVRTIVSSRARPIPSRDSTTTAYASKNIPRIRKLRYWPEGVQSCGSLPYRETST